MESKDLVQQLDKDLYVQISTDKSAEIARLKDEKIELLEAINIEQQNLERIKHAQKAIKNKLRISKKALRESRFKKIILMMKMRKQVKLATKLNRLFSSDVLYEVNVNAFYPENVESKTR